MTTVQPIARAATPITYTMPNFLLRLEGMATFVGCLTAYFYVHANGWLFALLLLTPDLSMLGYLRNPRFGALVYNLFHVIVWPLMLILIGVLAGSLTALTIGLIWLAHIGMDRTVGYGLKYTTAFNDTHLERV